MEQIKILFFALASFFGIEGGKIVSEKTTISIYPQNKKIEILQEGLFTAIQTKKDSTLVLEQWNKILNMKEKKRAWAKELNDFPVKSINFTPINNTIQPHLILNYAKENDLRTLGIWYNEERNEFSINNIPQYNIKTNDGKLDRNYWIFKAKDTITFTVKPFLQMPEEYKKLRKPLKKLLTTEKKTLKSTAKIAISKCYYSLQQTLQAI